MISVQIIRFCVRLRDNFMTRVDDMVRIRIRVRIMRTNEVENGIRVRVRVKFRLIRRLMD